MNQQHTLRRAARMGRGNDTELVHVNMGEFSIPPSVVDKDPALMSAIIRAFQKSGLDWRKYQVGGAEDSVNPQTGLKEYNDGDGDGDPGGGAPGSGGTGQGAAGDVGGGFGGGDDRQGDPVGGQGDPVGGGSSADLGAAKSASDLTGGDPVGGGSSADLGGARRASDLTGLEGPIGGSSRATAAPPKTMVESFKRAVLGLGTPEENEAARAQRVGPISGSELTAGIGVMGPMGFGPAMMGLGMLADEAERQGFKVDRPGQTASNQPSTGSPGDDAEAARDAAEAGSAPGKGDTGGRSEPPTRNVLPVFDSPQSPQSVQSIPQTPSLPDFLSALLGLSPLQQRAAIATYGTQSDESGRYGEEDVRKYYKDLVTRNLGLDENALPVERQYITRLGQFPANDTRDAFLAALRGL